MTDTRDPRDDPKPSNVVDFSGHDRRPLGTPRNRGPVAEQPEDEGYPGDVIAISAPAGGEPLPVTFSGNAPQRIIALAAVLVIAYFGRLVIIPILIAALLAFVLAPLVSLLERWRIPRPLGSGIGVVLLGGVIYAGSYFFYMRAVEFVHELPRYTQKIRESTLKYRKQAQVLQQTREAIAPEKPEDKNAVRVKQVESELPTAEGGLVEIIVAASFIPFLLYFMLSWQGHVHRATVQLFAPEHRTNAYVTISNMSRMMRGFIAGNFVVGLILGAASSAIFWWLGVPYFYFVGFISGFVSLVPYLGVVLALVPPVAAGIGTVPADKLTMLAGAVVVLHLVGVNVLYPKILGRHLQLNPLVVTASLLFFWFLWGGMGLLLAVPVTAAFKIVCDHIPELSDVGNWLSEGTEAR
ncbi:MAG TPA: AI-2E family transporter [Terriglobales bacterium]|nr:AI-2E family transporter [Terriglobales bacterium]